GDAGRRVWRLTGETGAAAQREKYTFFVDQRDETLVNVENEVLHSTIDGTVRAMVTPGTRPDTAQNRPALRLIPAIRARATGGGTAVTDEEGGFSIGGSGTPALVSSTTAEGAHVLVQTAAGPSVTASGMFVPDVAGVLTLNALMTEFETAQVNAFVH